ncbi:carbon storage regulator, CsrA [Clostridium cavendishii DSM 21758]|uniref:Translational regulator CsrA n=1 Tax=Clostridium cavendishii DSM 21758 TaxID=1121302 RepID=A0A1M6B2V5_9CLOT|nr:carbon storage regulator CsrA [Clostridium cavendishii]SHI42997.1 carbon storage regulator, CsrA [Clostridium cavendishii DSM 21758]
MLIVTRKQGEGIVIGDNIEVSVVKLENGSVKLAINAPKEVKILRKELLKEVQDENKEAVFISLEALNKLIK